MSTLFQSFKRRVLPRMVYTLAIMYTLNFLVTPLIAQQTQFDFINATGAPANFTQSFTIPACVTSITVEAWGGSGGGRGVTGATGGGGGGGGAYVRSVLTVTPGTVYSVRIGTPGQANSTASAGDSWFGSSTLVMAKGGFSTNNGTGGLGGAATASVGQFKFSGGRGGDYDGDGGGGGGATGGPNAIGAAGANGNLDFGGAGGIGANGFGNGGAGGADNAAGQDNITCPGCGGGGGSGTNGATGGRGSQGYVRVKIPALVYGVLSSPQTICPTGSPAQLSVVASGGNSTNYTYEWQSSITGNSADFVTISGALPIVSNTFNPPAINQTTWYRAIVREGTCDPFITDTVKVYVSELSGSVSFPQTICNGSTPSPLTALVQPGGIPVNYQWQTSTSSASGFINIGTNVVTYAPPGPLTSEQWHRVIISGNPGSGCNTYTTSSVNAFPTSGPAIVNVGKKLTTIYSTNTYTLINSSVSGSATTGAWTISSGPGTLSSTSQTDKPNEVSFTPLSAGFTGTVVLTLTSNSNGCTIAADTKTIVVLPSYLLNELWSASGDYTWVVPGCVNTITVQTWGAGGGGGGANASAYDGGGGGGGAFSSSVMSVIQGTTYSLSVGAGGSASFTTKGVKGGDSWFGSPSTVMAQGGAGGVRNGATGEDGSGGVGGQANAGYGQIKYSGGVGGRGGLWPGGGGGSSAGYFASGIDGRGTNNGWADAATVQALTPGGIAPVGGGNGGFGGDSNDQGNGIAGVCDRPSATAGVSPGGGGGGGVNACDFRGMPGADGQVRLVWGPAIPVFIDVTVSPSETVCLGETIKLMADSEFPVHYSWSTGSTTKTASPTALKDTLTLKPTSTGTITVTLADLNNCASTIVKNIVVNAIPSLTVNPISICAGTTGTLSVIGSASSYLWSKGGETTVSMTASPTVTTEYSVIVQTANCPATITSTITVNPNQTIALTSSSVTANQSLCINTALTPITYTIGGGGSGATATGFPPGISGNYISASKTFSITGTPTATGTSVYTVTTSGSCSVTSITGTITVNPDATIALSSASGTRNQSLCINTAITPVTYTIGGGGNGATAIGLPPGVSGSYVSASNTFTMIGTPTVTGTYVYTVNASSNCLPAPITGTITVNPDQSIALTSASATANQTVCRDVAIAAVTYTIGGGGTGATATGLPGGVSDAYILASNTFSMTGTPTVTGVFVYSVNTTGTCLPTTITGTITVNTLPSGTVNGGVGICPGSAGPTVSFLGSNGSEPYRFTYDLINGASVSTATVTSTGASTYTLASPTITPGDYTYSLTGVRDNNGCFSTVNSVTTVTVLNAPLATVTVTSPTVCRGSAGPIVTFTGSNGVPAYTFQYVIVEGSTATAQTPVATTTLSSTYTLQVPTNNVGIFTYSLTGIQDAALSACGAASDYKTITVYSLPTATLSGSSTVCQGTSPAPQLSITSSSGQSPYTINYTQDGVPLSVNSASTIRC